MIVAEPWDVLFLGLSALSRNSTLGPVKTDMEQEGGRNVGRAVPENSRAEEGSSTSRIGDAGQEGTASTERPNEENEGHCADKDGTKIVIEGEAFQWVRKPAALTEADFCTRPLRDGDLGSHAYLLTRAGAGKLLRLPARLPTDILIVQGVVGGQLRGNLLSPSLVTQTVLSQNSPPSA
jgi:hypothetical protein